MALVRRWMDCLRFGGKLLGVAIVVWDFKTNEACSSRLEFDEPCQILSMESWKVSHCRIQSVLHDRVVISTICAVFVKFRGSKHIESYSPFYDKNLTRLKAEK